VPSRLVIQLQQAAVGRLRLLRAAWRPCSADCVSGCTWSPATGGAAAGGADQRDAASTLAGRRDADLAGSSTIQCVPPRNVIWRPLWRHLRDGPVGLVRVPGIWVDERDHPVSSDLAGDSPPPVGTV
jgi:hypothetical protein